MPSTTTTTARKTTTAVSPAGNKYHSQRTIENVTLRVIEFHEGTRPNGKVFWTDAKYEVTVAGSGKKATLVTKNGKWIVPGLTPPLKNPTVRAAIDAALKRPAGTLREPVRARRTPGATAAVPRPTATGRAARRSAAVPDDLEARLRASIKGGSMTAAEAQNALAEAADRQGLEAKPSARKPSAASKAREAAAARKSGS